MEKRALGKGLEALIPVFENENQKNSGRQVNPDEVIQKISIDKIKPNRYQARKKWDDAELKNLADSIRQNGIIQPLTVTGSVTAGEYELVAGERRLRAAKIAGLKEVPVIEKKFNEQEKFVISLLENIQRSDLDPIEEANGYSKLIEQFNLKQEDIAGMVHKDRSVIANTLRLLSLPEAIQELISQGHISSGHARTLAGLDDPQKQKDLAKRILNEKLTVREVEKIVSDWKSISGPIRKNKKHPEIISMEGELQNILGTKVELKSRGKKGKIIIHFYSLDQFENLVKTLKKYK